MGLILASFPKAVMMLTLIWDYDAFAFSWMVQAMVLTSNAQALSVVLWEAYPTSACLVGVGVLCRLAMQAIASLLLGLPMWVLH